MIVECGLQMHVVQKDVHQDTKGYITVVVRNLELVRKHLQAVEEALEGTQFRCAEVCPVSCTAHGLHVSPGQERTGLPCRAQTSSCRAFE